MVDFLIVPSVAFPGWYELTASKGEKKITILCESQDRAFTTITLQANAINVLLEA